MSQVYICLPPLGLLKMLGVDRIIYDPSTDEMLLTDSSEAVKWHYEETPEEGPSAWALIPCRRCEKIRRITDATCAYEGDYCLECEAILLADQEDAALRWYQRD